MEDKSFGLFGPIPSRHYVWFEHNSGTKYNDKKKEWVVDGKQIIKETKKQFGYYKANEFQDSMIRMKTFIRSKMMPGEGYDIDNNLVFDLMRFGKCNIEYIYQGKKYQRDIVT